MLITLIISAVILTIVSGTATLVDGIEFVINSTSATDNSTVNWWIAP